MRPCRLLAASAAVALVLCAPSASRAGAQIVRAERAPGVRGSIYDPGAMVPIVGADVTLLSGGDRVGTVSTDASGSFFLSAPASGAYRLEVRRIGYAPSVSEPFDVPPGTLVTVEFGVPPDAISIAPLVVTAHTQRGMDQFLTRMEEWGKGIFVTPAMIDSIDPQHYVDVFRDREDIWVSWIGSNGRMGAYGIEPTVRTFRGEGCMRYMVDGAPIRYGLAGNDYLMRGLGREIVAAEIYRSVGEVPPPLRHVGDQVTEWQRAGVGLGGEPGATYAGTDIAICGVTVFWTARAW